MLVYLLVPPGWLPTQICKFVQAVAIAMDKVRQAGSFSLLLDTVRALHQLICPNDASSHITEHARCCNPLCLHRRRKHQGQSIRPGVLWQAALAAQATPAVLQQLLQQLLTGCNLQAVRLQFSAIAIQIAIQCSAIAADKSIVGADGGLGRARVLDI